MFSGRSLDAKHALCQGIVQGLAPLDSDASDIAIVIYEVPPENRGIRGGVPASEVELGFKVDV